MNLVVIVTLAAVAIAVLAIAGYLALVAYKLNKVSFTVGTILIGVRSIANQTEPVGTVVNAIAGDVTHIENALAGLLAPGELPSGDESSIRRRRRALRANR